MTLPIMVDPWVMVGVVILLLAMVAIIGAFLLWDEAHK